MRILHVCQFLGIGGLEQVLFLLAQEQIALGHEVHLVVYDHDQRWVEKFQKANIRVMTQIKKKKGIDLSMLDQFENIIGDYDIVHTHDLNPGFYFALLKFRMKIQGKKLSFIHTTHGMEHLKLDPKTFIFEALLGIMADKILTVSPKFQNFYQAQFFTKSSKVELIENGTKVPAETRFPKPQKLIDDLNLNPEQPIALYIARVVPLKGQLELIQKYKDLDHQLLLVGPSGDQKYFNQCKENLSSNIKMLGSRADINDLIDLCDYYVSHSFHEGLPISVLEAGARNKPCLLLSIPGHIQFNKESHCVDLFQENEFKDKLETLPEISSKLSTNFRILIEKKYSSNAMTEKVMSCYREVIC